MRPDTESLASQLRAVLSELQVVMRSENTERGERCQRQVVAFIEANYPELNPAHLGRTCQDWSATAVIGSAVRGT